MTATDLEHLSGGTLVVLGLIVCVALAVMVAAWVLKGRP